MRFDEVDHVFVYGSLKKGQPLYSLEPLAQFRLEIVPARIRNAVLYDLGPFPGIVLEPAGGVVAGEVHHFRQLSIVLEVLDEVEDYYGEGDPRNLYRRVRAEAEVEAGRLLPCWLYEYVGPMDGARRIESGAWRGVG